jgi:7-cyano-7-deazaguanine synthase
MGNKAVVLLSGGIDSSTALAVAKSEGYNLYSLSFDYHQKHKRELQSANMVASSLGTITQLVMRIDLRKIGGSALTSEIEVPKKGMQDKGYRLKDKENTASGIAHRASSLIPVTYVPARNTIFLSFALAWAEVLEADTIVIGANAIDYSGYPDCRPEYLEAFESMANLAVKASVEGRVRFKILAPLLYLKKSEIVKKGINLGLDYSLTWSCYDPQPGKGLTYSKVKTKWRAFEDKVIPCGRCDSCVFRAKGFREAGMRDPLFYR